MSKFEDQLATLHTAAVDAGNGYGEALKKSDGKGLSSLFAELQRLHGRHASELAGMLVKRGRTADKDGSFMSLVHETIMDVRALVGGLDESVLPGLIDGEKRNIAKYDDALSEPGDSQAEPALGRQRAELAAIVDRMSAMKQAEAGGAN